MVIVFMLVESWSDVLIENKGHVLNVFTKEIIKRLAAAQNPEKVGEIMCLCVLT